MKKIITLIALFCAYSFSYAQLGNPDFENWESPLLTNAFSATGSFGGITFYVCAPNFTYQEAENWSSTNQLTNTPNLGSVELVTQSAIAHTGSSSIRIESADLSITGWLDPGCALISQGIDNVAPGLIVNGKFNLDVQDLIDELLGGQGINALNPFTYPGVGEPIDFLPKTLTGQYQYTGAIDATTGVTDSCVVVSGLKKDGELIGFVISKLGNAASWTEFSLDYTHLTCGIPDTIVTVISSSNLALEIIDNVFVINNDNTGTNGSVMFVDNLHIDTMNLADLPPLLMPDTEDIFIAEVATIAVLDNDEFCDMGTYAPILEIAPINGSVVINASNEMVYTPNASFTGTEFFTYYICNTNLVCDTTLVTVNVNPVPICFANDDVRTVVSGSTDQFDPKANDVDCGTTIGIAANPSNGTVTVESNNFLTYAPNGSFIGADNFDYYICSNANPNQCDTATVSFSVISGLNEIDFNLISIHPNPANDVLNITVDLNEQIEVVMFNAIGKIVAQEVFENSKAISLTNINTGFYFMEIKAGNKKSVRKIQVIK